MPIFKMRKIKGVYIENRNCQCYMSKKSIVDKFQKGWSGPQFQIANISNKIKIVKYPLEPIR